MSDPSSREKSGELVSTAIDSDNELQAIRAVLSALVPLKREGRTRVLDYVLKRLGMSGIARIRIWWMRAVAHTRLRREMGSGRCIVSLTPPIRELRLPEHKVLP
jgi:hypothetical protein